MNLINYANKLIKVRIEELESNFEAKEIYFTF